MRVIMGIVGIIAGVAAGALVTAAGAQVMTPVARRAADVWNAPGTTRADGAFDVATAREIAGSVAVLNGPVDVSGTIAGSLVAINADVRLHAGARVQRDLIVIGGTVTGLEGSMVGGEILQQAELLRYHLDGTTLQIDHEPEYDDSWWKRQRIRREWTRGEANAEFFHVASRTYNRVEGWSFVAGPRVTRTHSWGKSTLELFGVGRTASPREWNRGSIGHDARFEVMAGRRNGFAVGVRAFDVISPTERWQIGDGEAGLSAAFLRQDFRDLYARHGGAVYAKAVWGSDADLTVSLSDEQWAPRVSRDPWSFTRGTIDWRPNPVMDAGSVHLLTTQLRVDTRRRASSPFGGWFVSAELEQGGGTITRHGLPIATILPMQPEPVWYSRAFIDVRRYNRIAPGMSLELRVAGGGWVAGDALPTQRRLGVGGPGTMPGYAFRESPAGADILNCTTGIVQAGTPAQCDRVALAQAQLRSGFLFNEWRDDGRDDDDWWRPGFNMRTAWVLFVDAGRGWMVGSPNAGTPGMFAGRNALPPLSSFKVDVGAGLDLGGIGLYWARAMNNGSDNPIRFVARLQRRF